MRRFYTFLLIVTLFNSLFAEKSSVQQNLQFQRLNTEELLNNITDIYQDSYGFMWFCAKGDGLYRYDGIRMLKFENDPLDTNTISSNNVSKIIESANGNFFIATHYGINEYITKEDRFVLHIPEVNGRELQIPIIFNVFEDSKQRLWLTTRKHIMLMEKDSNNKWKYRAFPSIDPSAAPITSFIEDKYGDILFGGIQGLFRYNESSKKFEPLFKQLHKRSRVNQLVLDRFNNIWVSTTRKLYYLERDNSKKKYSVDHYRGAKQESVGSFTSSNVLGVVETDNKIWVHYSNGFDVLIPDHYSDRNKRTIYSYGKNQVILNFNEAFDIIKSIYKDKSGIIWLATNTGIFKYDKQTTKFTHIKPDVDAKQGMVGNSVRNMFEAPDGRIWVITNFRGLEVYDPKSSRFHQIQQEGNLRFAGIRTVHYEEDHLIYALFGVVEPGVYKLKLKKDYWKDLNFKNAQAKRIPIVDDKGKNIIPQGKSLFKDSKSNLWISTRGDGLIKLSKDDTKPGGYRSKVYRSFSTQNDLTETNVSMIAEDALGYIWIATRGKGLFVLNPENEEFKFYSTRPFMQSVGYDNVMYLHVDNKNEVWVGTLQNGLLKYNREDDTFTRYTKSAGLPSNNIYGILSDSLAQHIWISSDKGLSRLDLQTNTINNYNLYDGLQNNNFHVNSCLKAKDETMYFGGVNGFNAFRSDDIIKTNTFIPNVVISELLVNHVPVKVEPNNKNAILKKNLILTKKISLKPTQNNIIFRFAALSYSASPRNKYQYKLEGLDNDWVSADATAAFAVYNNLGHGKYTFLVKGSNSEGLWNDKPRALEIIITPHLYKTLGFKIVLAMIISALIVAIFYLRTYTMRRNTKLLELTVRERTKEISSKNWELRQKARELYEVNTALEERQQRIEEQAETLKKQKDELEYQKIELEALNITKDKLFSIIAHDIKNPFSTIIGFANITLRKLDGLTKDKLVRNLNIINESSQSLLSLIDNLLSWSRSQMKNPEFKPEVFALPDIIDVVISSVKSSAEVKDNVIITKVQECLVEADKNMLTTLLRNLLNNANKFTSEGEIKISAFLNNNELQIEIADTGVGIDESTQKKLFNTSTMVSNTGTNGEKGTGLGLIIVKDFVEAHKGKINLESLPGKGAKFIIQIPQKENVSYSKKANKEMIN